MRERAAFLGTILVASLAGTGCLNTTTTGTEAVGPPKLSRQTTEDASAPLFLSAWATRLSTSTKVRVAWSRRCAEREIETQDQAVVKRRVVSPAAFAWAAPLVVVGIAASSKDDNQTEGHTPDAKPWMVGAVFIAAGAAVVGVAGLRTLGGTEQRPAPPRTEVLAIVPSVCAHDVVAGREVRVTHAGREHRGDTDANGELVVPWVLDSTAKVEVGTDRAVELRAR